MKPPEPTIMNSKIASTDYPIHELLTARWSPYAFDDRSVAIADLRSLFEAARWAPSSYNEQPWSLAAENLVLEATSRGLSVHQMIGIEPERARATYGIPEQFQAWTAMAIGYRGEPTNLPEGLQERDLMPRKRKRLAEFVFAARWGESSPLVR
jgi:nitroreductase